LVRGAGVSASLFGGEDNRKRAVDVKVEL